MLQYLVNELPLPDVSAANSGRDPAVFVQILGLAADLQGAGVGAIVLGCSGMAQLAQHLENDLGILVIDPVAAAARLAQNRCEAGPD